MYLILSILIGKPGIKFATLLTIFTILYNMSVIGAYKAEVFKGYKSVTCDVTHDTLVDSAMRSLAADLTYVPHLLLILCIYNILCVFIIYCCYRYNKRL